MAANKKCPRCGAEIPEDAPGGACPQCALRDALGIGAYDAKNVNQDANTVPMHIDEKQRSRITQTIAFQKRLRQILFASRWVVAAVFIVIAGYVLVRHVWMAGHVRPHVYLTEDLRLKFESEQLDVSPQATLVSVNGRPVNILSDVYTAFDDGGIAPANLVFEHSVTAGTTQTVELTLLRANQPLHYTVTPDGLLQTNEANAALTENLSDTERVVAVNRLPLAQLAINGEVSNVVFYPNREIASYTMFKVVDSSTGAERDVVLWLDNSLLLRGRLLSGIGFLGLGLLVFWLRPDTRSSAGFLFFCTVLALFYLVRSISTPYRLPAELESYYLLQGLVPAASAAMLVTFTPLRALVRRPGIFSLACLFLAALFLIVNSANNPKHVEIGLLSTGMFQLWAFVLLAMFLLSLPMDWWLRVLRIPISPTDKQRSRTLRIAFVMGLSPTLVYTAGWSRSFSWTQFGPLVEVSVLIFPALIGYAIVRHNLLRLNELARESVMYGLLMALLTGFYVTGTSVVVPVAQQYLPEAAQWTQSIVLAGAMAAILPVHSATRRLIERRFNRIPFEFEQFLSAVEREGSDWHGPVDYCHMVASQLARMVDTSHITVLTHYPNEDDWSISASTNPTDSDTASESCKMLCALLEQERSEVFRDDVLEGFRYRVIQREILDGLEALDAAIVIPLISRGQVVGAISLGDKSGNMNYSAAELHVLKRIASHVAGTLYNLMTLSSITTGTRICDIWPDWPERIGGYAIERPLGEGGMACVFLGRRDGKPYAIKVANRLVQSNSRLMERFHREASAVQRLNHPHIVKIVEVGWDGPEPFIVFEYFQNGALDQMVNPKDPLDIPSVIKYGLQMAEALQYAHEQGVIHRDIKPRNIFLDDDFNVKIGDFGLAQIADRSTLTQKGEFFGTPDYLAPELLKGGKSSIQSDMYALGVTLFELAAGKRPFSGETTDIVAQRKNTEDAPLLSWHRVAVCPEFEAAVRQLLARTPQDRYADYSAVVVQLEKLTNEPSPR